MTKEMFNKLLLIEKLKASIEERKAYIILWQTKILSGTDKSVDAHNILANHIKLLSESSELIKGIVEEEI